MKYVYANGSFHNILEAQVVGEELERIRNKVGALTARSVWVESRDPNALLHKHFEWSNREAADKYRDYQAGTLIRSVRIMTDAGHEAPAFIHIRLDERRYEPVERVLNDAELRKIAIQDALNYLASARRRLADLKEFADELIAIEKIEAKISRRKK